jgi:hypothetical protein
VLCGVELCGTIEQLSRITEVTWRWDEVVRCSKKNRKRVLWRYSHADRMTYPSFFSRTSMDASGSKSESNIRAFCLQCTGQKKDISTSTAIHLDLIRHL